ncbi:hypothetical protein [Reinekea marinisedimentorum]|uniref:Uncharacterized protein n=1 Tax=Reinekea marinisedimentorum TaxID=230495 RepID=A0A4R3I585_9GAMM|nr:hypothetical protein [Reinekea marinisedimentorum]TCS40422.1 hypothetical protein BCF53_109132 [Reinekea marinisedimentorum]
MNTNRINRYFEVCNLIDQKLPKSTYWDTNDETLILEQHNEERSLSVEQMSSVFEVEIDKVKAFFEVHSYLSNNIDLLTQQKEYECWYISGVALVVEFKDSPAQVFSAEKIEQAYILTLA